MSDGYLSAEDFDRFIDLSDLYPEEAATLREYAAIVDAVAVDSAPIEVFVMSKGKMMRCKSCLCVWYEGEPQSHAAGCIGIRARKVRGYE